MPCASLLSQDRISEQRAKRERFLSMTQSSSSIKKGLIRYLVLVVDLSRACSSEHLDLRPNRLTCMIRVVRRFIRDYFDQNPLSQLGVMITRDGVAIQLTDLSGSPETQIKKLNESNLSSSGDASLQNVLDLGLTMLESVPPYGHREVRSIADQTLR
jgi:transcription initiation factor TFIIH subunit 2